MSRIIRQTLMVSFVLAAMMVFTTNVQAGTCPLKSSGSVTTSVFTGTPTVACPQGVPVVSVTISLAFASPVTELRCGISDEPLTIMANGRTYVIGPSKGYDWEDVLNGNCAALNTRIQ